MTKRPAYAPILRAKQGESIAVRRLSGGLRREIHPLIDVPMVDMDWEKNCPKRSLESHLAAKAKEIARMVGEGEPATTDLFDIPLEARTEGGRHPVVELANNLRDLGLASIPTTGLDRDAEYQESVMKIADRNGLGVCIRLLPEDADLYHTLADSVGGLLRELKIDSKQCNVIADLRSVLDADVELLAVNLAKAIDKIGGLGSWRQVSLAACGLPQYVSQELEAGSVGLVQRKELRLWHRLRELGCRLVYGDYATVHPDLIYEDPRKLAKNMGPNLRYALQSDWLLLRGHAFKKHPEGRKQYYGLARKLRSRPEFRGRGFSYGDDYVEEKADNKGGPGSPTTWVTMSVNRHLTLTTTQMLSTADDL